MTRFSFFLLLLLTTGWATVARADFAKDLARIHTEAVGGRERVDALKTFKATGVTRNESGELRFTMWAARPNRIRTEVAAGARVVMQGWNGSASPWRADSETRRIVRLDGDEAAEFRAEAEFDDPLLAGPDRRVSLDYGGVVEADGRRLLKILVTQNFSETSLIYLDAETYLIARRDVVRRRPSGEMVLRTDYADFRPVNGVLLPHRVIVSRDGARVNETIIEHIEANPTLPAGLFEKPATADMP